MDLTAQASTARVERWTRVSMTAVALVATLFALLAFGPALFSANVMNALTRLFVYVILAVMWNALAGYGGLISVGQQGFFGLGAYAAIRLADTGLNPFAAMFLGAALLGLLAYPISMFILRLKEGPFAIGTWVLSELAMLLVTLDPIVHGDTGTSLLQLTSMAAPVRRAITYWSALGAMVALLAVLFVLLRHRVGVSIQAIRDDEGAAGAVGVRVMATKRLLFVIAAVASAAAGGLWLATTITFQPPSFFSVNWSAFMIFMVLVGGIGTFEGAIIGAVIFFLLENFLGGAGVWYLVTIGAVSLAFALVLPRGIWGLIARRFGFNLLPVGYRVRW
ncbi:MAG TPA: branched-chain amino acid ABC transporter permease [Rhodanobacteraceae bacterium]|nr:branched-chain amino acid ABC transporter permease [Rhodanobacteraceae bacterium]